MKEFREEREQALKIFITRVADPGVLAGSVTGLNI